MSLLYFVPSETEVSSYETLPLAVDVAGALTGGESLFGTPTFFLFDLRDDTDFSATGLSGTASTAGTVVTQSVHALVAHHTYMLVCVFQSSGGAKTQARALKILVPY